MVGKGVDGIVAGGQRVNLTGGHQIQRTIRDDHAQETDDGVGDAGHKAGLRQVAGVFHSVHADNDLRLTNAAQQRD